MDTQLQNQLTNIWKSKERRAGFKSPSQRMWCPKMGGLPAFVFFCQSLRGNLSNGGSLKGEHSQKPTQRPRGKEAARLATFPLFRWRCVKQIPRPLSAFCFLGVFFSNLRKIAGLSPLQKVSGKEVKSKRLYLGICGLKGA